MQDRPSDSKSTETESTNPAAQWANFFKSLGMDTKNTTMFYDSSTHSVKVVPTSNSDEMQKAKETYPSSITLEKLNEEAKSGSIVKHDKDDEPELQKTVRIKR